jgi:predicted ferric reductase
MIKSYLFMKSHTITLKKISFLNHNVVQLKVTKPDNYNFIPGQATDVSILKDGWTDEKRPFTFTSLPDQNHLEFTIKTYDSHDGVTEQIGKLENGDKLLIGEPYGAIKYKGSGMFIAGGAGITPFLPIFKQLESENKAFGHKLLFANKKEEDIFLKKKLDEILGDDFINILSEEDKDDYKHGHINADIIRENSNTLKQFFYVCGPPKMIEHVIEELNSIGVDQELIVTEDFEG